MTKLLIIYLDAKRKKKARKCKDQPGGMRIPMKYIEKKDIVLASPHIYPFPLRLSLSVLKFLHIVLSEGIEMHEWSILHSMGSSIV